MRNVVHSLLFTGSKHCSLPHLWPFRKGPALVGVTAIEAEPRLATGWVNVMDSKVGKKSLARTFGGVGQERTLRVCENLKAGTAFSK